MNRSPIRVALSIESRGEPRLDVGAVVRAAQAGDKVALRTLFEVHRQAVFGFCLLAASRDRDRALDFLQEAFARAFQALPRLRDPERFRSWLFAVAANVCRTRAAQEQQHRRLVETALLEQQAELAPEDPAERETRIAAVQRVLAHVPEERLREIVQLKYGEPEHTTREIAAKLSIPHGTVTVKLMRFRAAIRRELCRELLEEGES